MTREDKLIELRKSLEELAIRHITELYGPPLWEVINDMMDKAADSDKYLDDMCADHSIIAPTLEHGDPQLRALLVLRSSRTDEKELAEIDRFIYRRKQELVSI